MYRLCRIRQNARRAWCYRRTALVCFEPRGVHESRSPAVVTSLQAFAHFLPVFVVPQSCGRFEKAQQKLAPWFPSPGGRSSRKKGVLLKETPIPLAQIYCASSGILAVPLCASRIRRGRRR